MNYKGTGKNGAMGRGVHGSSHTSSLYPEGREGLVLLKVIIRLFGGVNPASGF